MTEGIKSLVAAELPLFTRICFPDLHNAVWIRQVEICYQQYKNICHAVKFNEREAWKKILQSRDTIRSLEEKFEPYNLFIGVQNDQLTHTGWGRKAPLEITWSKPLLRAGSTRAG